MSLILIISIFILQLEDEELPDDEMSPTVSTFSSPSRSLINNGNHQQECIQHHQIPEPTRRVKISQLKKKKDLNFDILALGGRDSSINQQTFDERP